MNFDGSILIRAQQPTAVMRLLNCKEPPPPNGRNELLSFLASIVLAGKSGLKFDPTIPLRDLDNAMAACAKLSMDGVSIGQPSGVDTTRIAKASSIAFQYSTRSENWLKILKDPPAVDSRFDSAQDRAEDIRKFVCIFSQIQDLSDDAGALIKLGHQLSSPHQENVELWGNKLLAGMAIAQADYLNDTSQLEPEANPFEFSPPISQTGLYLKKSNELDLNYRLISAMIVNFRDYLMPTLAGQYSCIYSSAKPIDYLGRIKFNQLAVLELLIQKNKGTNIDLLELRERMRICSMDNSFATKALAHIGAHVLEEANPRDGQLGLVSTALKLAENNQFSALLKWAAKRQSKWEETLADNLDLKEEAYSLNDFVISTIRELRDPRKDVIELVCNYSGAAVGGILSGALGWISKDPKLAICMGGIGAVGGMMASNLIDPKSIPFIQKPRSYYLGALDLTSSIATSAELVDQRLKALWK